MAISRKLKSFYMNFWEIPETWVANCITYFQEFIYLRKNLAKGVKLTKEQKKQIKDFWKPYCSISPKWCLYYSSQNGLFDPKYIPNNLYYTTIDQFFNNRKLGYGFNDKNYYQLIFPDVKQPETIVHIIGGLLFDKDYIQINASTAISLISNYSEVILKPSQESGSGRDIHFFDTKKDIEDLQSKIKDFINKNNSNYIIQNVLEQHKSLKIIHEQSVNTVRVCTLMLDDCVHILSSVLRMGVNKGRIDNVTAGGISVGINPDGTLKKLAYTYYTGESFEKHPQGFVFDGYQIPNYNNLINTVKKLAQKLGNFKLVSWDMAVDKYGDIVLIEANMRKGGINLHQFDNGPIFGNLTEKVLNLVFKK